MGILGILLCFVPLAAAFLIFTFGYKIKFTHQLLATLFGLVAIFPISVIQYFVPNIPNGIISPLVYSLIKSLIVYGLVEELVKMALLWPLPHKETLNFLLLSFVLGLSLACFESVVYFFDHLQIANNRGAQLLYGQIALRIFTSDIIHMTCTGLCGLFVYTCRQKKARTSFFITAILLHGIYDFFAGYQNGLRWFSIAVVLMAIAECRIKYVSLKNVEKE